MNLVKPNIANLLNKFLIRPVLLAMTTMVVILALTQSFGRISVSFVSGLTPRVNATLAPLNVKVVGLTASWRGLNPIVEIAKLKFGAGQIEALELEIDFFASLIEGAWVPAVLHWDQFHLYVDQTALGWRLRDQGNAELPFDLEKIARRGGRIFGDIEVHLTPVGAASQTYLLGLDLVNTSAERIVLVDIAFADKVILDQALSGTDLQSLTVGYLQKNPGAFAPGYSEEYFVGGSLTVPRGIIADSDFLLSLSNGYLKTLDGIQTTGQTNVRIVASDSLLLSADVGIDFGLRLQSLDRHLIGAVSKITLFNASKSIELSDFLLRLDPSRGNDPFINLANSPAVQLWSEQQDIGEVSDFLIGTTQPSQPLSEWLSALSASGVAKNLHLFADSKLAFGYAFAVENVQFHGYRGVPALNNAGGQIWGDSRNIGLMVHGEDMTMLFPDLFKDEWQLDSAEGELSLIIRPGYVALRGENIVAVRGDSTITGEFATTRPQAKYEQRVAATVQVDTAGLDHGQSYVPYKLSPGLYNWLKTAPEKGRFDNVELALQSQIHVLPERKFDRRFELLGDFSSVQVRYLQGWPKISNARGHLKVLGQETLLENLEGQSLGIDFTQATAKIDRAGVIAVDFSAEPTAQAILDFIRSSPLQEHMLFVEDDWRVYGEGFVATVAHIEVPLVQALTPVNAEPTGTTAIADLSPTGLLANLSLQVSGVSLDMPSYKISVEDIQGAASFTLPHHFHGQLKASMFDQPAVITSDSDEQWLKISVDGQIDAAKITQLLGIDAPGVLQGDAEFSSLLNLSMNGGVSNLAVNTDLLGMHVNLPAEFGKPQEVAEQSEFNLKFLPEAQQLDWQFKSTQGWLLVPPTEQGNPLSGKISGGVGISATPPMPELAAKGLKIVGQLPRLDIADWITEDGEAAVVLPFDWQIQDLNVGELVVADFVFDDVTLNGQDIAEELSFVLKSDDIIGRVDLSDAEIIDIDLSFLRLPQVSQFAEDGVTRVDSMPVEIGKALPRANVRVGSLHLGDESFGAWEVNIEPQAAGIRFDIRSIDIKGVHIKDSVAFWDLDSNRTSFSGAADLDNLITTLPAWGYIAVVETGFARLSGNISWPGSPANLNIVDGEGGIAIIAKDGRFLDVEAGQNGLRLVSLLNVSALTKRINLDFSDVVDEGISFSRMAAEIQLENKQLSFNKNLIVKSTSSTYELGGMVDFAQGTLNNEMIVTLPVSDNLPWYAAYVALANPLAGIGVAIGERILRKPIQRMSSAKFSVAGSIDDPEVKFLTLWGQSIDAVPEAGERLSPDLFEKAANVKDNLDAPEQDVVPKEQGPLLDIDANQ